MAHDDTSGDRPPASPDEIVGGCRTLPPGSGPVPSGRQFKNPYIERLAEYPGLILTGDQAEPLRGRWLTRWPCAGGSPPLCLEIGCGNGFFFRDLCLRHPDHRFVGIEIRYKRVWMSARKLAQAGCSNGVVVLHHAGYLGRLFANDELSAIYLNHPDPWPKDRHARNRLITPDFATLISRLLRRDGTFQIKSDCSRYADETRRCFASTPMTEQAYTADLHRPGDPLAEGNIVTNYERKFVERGEPVFLQRWGKD